MSGAGVDRMREQTEVKTLLNLEKDRGKDELWDHVNAFIAGLGPDMLEKIQYILTGDKNGDCSLDLLDEHGQSIGVPNHEHRLLLSYLYYLAKTGKLADVFGKMFKGYFEAADAAKGKKKLDKRIPTFDEITSLMKKKKTDKGIDDAFEKLAERLGVLEAAADAYGLTLPPMIKSVTDARDTEAAIASMTDLGPFKVLLKAFLDDVARVESAIAAPVSPPAGEEAVYFCMQAEHGAKGKRGEALERYAAESFSKFAVYAMSEDFGAKPESTKTVNRMKDDVVGGVRLAVQTTTFQHKGVNSVLAEIPMCKGLTVDSDAHAIEHALDPVKDLKLIASVIAHLKHKAEELCHGHFKWIHETDLAKAKKIIFAIEDYLAKRLAAQIYPETGVESKDVYKRVKQATDDLHKPFYADPHKRHHDLKATKEPKHEGESGHEKEGGKGGLLGKLGHFGTMALGVKEGLDILGITGKRKKGGGGGAQGPKQGH